MVDSPWFVCPKKSPTLMFHHTLPNICCYDDDDDDCVDDDILTGFGQSYK